MPTNNKLLFLANAMMTLGFGVAALVAPLQVFGMFGLSLRANTNKETTHQVATIIRGYASAALGYGLVMWLLQSETEPRVVRALTMASLVFNVAETGLQTYAIVNGAGFNHMIYSTCIPHAILALWSILSLFLLATCLPKRMNQ